MVALPRHRKLLLLYFRYKDSAWYISSVIALIFIISFVVLVYVVLPQFDAFWSVNNEIATTKQRITILKNNITYLTSISGAKLDSDLSLAFAALPSEKDFAAVIDAVNSTAVASGVVVNDYSVEIGELATPSATLKQFYSVDLLLTINGNKSASKDFLGRIHQVLPIAQVKSVSLTEDSSTMKISFFFKPFPTETYDVEQPIKPIPADAAAVVNTISLWHNDTPVSASESDNSPPPVDPSLENPF